MIAKCLHHFLCGVRNPFHPVSDVEGCFWFDLVEFWGNSALVRNSIRRQMSAASLTHFSATIAAFAKSVDPGSLDLASRCFSHLLAKLHVSSCFPTFAAWITAVRFSGVLALRCTVHDAAGDRSPAEKLCAI